MDTLRQLVEGLQSSTLTAPPTPLPTTAVQTSTRQFLHPIHIQFHLPQSLHLGISMGIPMGI